MTIKVPSRLYFSDFLITLTTIDTVLFGTGRIIMFGPISFRYLLLGLTLLDTIYLACNRRIELNASNKALFIMIGYFIIPLSVGILKNGLSEAGTEFFGYATILLCPFYIYYFSTFPEKIDWWLKLFRGCILILAFIQLFLYADYLVTGWAAYIRWNNVLINSGYGFTDIFGPGIAIRIYLKDSVYLAIGLFFEIEEFFQGRARLNTIIKAVLFAAGLLTTFSIAIYGATALCVIILAAKNLRSQKAHRVLLFLFVLLIIALIIANRMGLSQVLDAHNTGGYSGSNFRNIQIMAVINAWASQPIFGNGFGSTVFIDYGYGSSRNIAAFEIMWLQLLLHTGIVGTVLYIWHIGTTVKKCFLNYQMLNSPMYSVLGVVVLFFCILSFGNPYMNGSIALIPYAMITGIAFSETIPLSDSE